MLKVDISDEFTQSLANKVIKQLVPILIEKLKQEDFPPLLTRKQFMELAGIGETKCNELFHRRDFPVNRELGHPRVPTKQFFEWVAATNQNAGEVNLKYPYDGVI